MLSAGAQDPEEGKLCFNQDCKTDWHLFSLSDHLRAVALWGRGHWSQRGRWSQTSASQTKAFTTLAFSRRHTFLTTSVSQHFVLAMCVLNRPLAGRWARTGSFWIYLIAPLLRQAKQGQFEFEWSLDSCCTGALWTARGPACCGFTSFVPVIPSSQPAPSTPQSRSTSADWQQLDTLTNSLSFLPQPIQATDKQEPQSSPKSWPFFKF